jgi:Na+/H+ antiporter NhaD/arsenite permease-like protein
VHRVAAALGGAALMLGLRLVAGRTASHSVDAGIDWNVTTPPDSDQVGGAGPRPEPPVVIFLLIGMMVIVGVIQQTGLVEYLAIAAAKRARGRPFALLALLVLITAVASALLDNVTTVLLIVPVTLVVCDRLALNPIPYLIAEVLASNIGGTATLIDAPPNTIIASRGGLTFNDFLVHLAPFIVVLVAVFIGLCRRLFRAEFRSRPDRVAEVMALSERDAIQNRRLLWQSMIVLALVLAGFVPRSALHVEPRWWRCWAWACWC